MQKTFRQDFISRKTIKNPGQLPMYLIENHHDAIVDRDKFNIHAFGAYLHFHPFAFRPHDGDVQRFVAVALGDVYKRQRHSIRVWFSTSVAPSVSCCPRRMDDMVEPPAETTGQKATTRFISGKVMASPAIPMAPTPCTSWGFFARKSIAGC